MRWIDSAQYHLKKLSLKVSCHILCDVLCGLWHCSLKCKRNDQITNSCWSHAFVGILVKTCYHPSFPHSLSPPIASPGLLRNFLIVLPGIKKLKCSFFQFNSLLSIFFTAFHCLVLASFCSSKNPDWIQSALFLNRTTHSPRVRHLKGR